MSENTVTSVVRRKRAKRLVDNAAFDAFARRILRAYARRVATGDLEALRSLAMLTGEVDAVTRLAVLGLKQATYSWSDIAAQLGTSRQAAQMRYGDKTSRGVLDQRLTSAGLTVTVSTLVAVFAEHHPGIPAALLCPGCGYRYPDGVTDCPTNATVRPLLFRRRAEDKKALLRLSADQFADLHSSKSARINRVAAVLAARPATSPDHTAPPLFSSVNGKDCQP